MHGKTNNLGDISKIDVKDIPEHDLFTYSFPCTDISVAGKMLGLSKGSGTRSGLLWECQRIIEHCKPKYLLMENVKNLVGKKFKPEFDSWEAWLKKQGYSNYWKVLNAKDYNIPQNRERVFMVSILGEHKKYEFPKGFPLKTSIKDILEENVPDKCYLSDILLNKFIPNETFLLNKIGKKFDVSKIEAGFIQKSENGKKHQSNTVMNGDYISRSLTAGDYKAPPMVLLEDKLFCELRCDEGIRLYNNNICGTVVAKSYGGKKAVLEMIPNFKIRRLTATECFRLMGMNDRDIQLINEAGISSSQQYKMAGNSITIPVLEEIFKNLFLK
ncbi:TPA: DNA (cytosine-5-)-methyltransferase [Clostridioides difficile]|nr:DNA (cytosine-5-)-methyltransferase [Clostridioides difficile]